MAELCNRCGGEFVPCRDSIVPAWECADCHRLVPRTAITHAVTHGATGASAVGAAGPESERNAGHMSR